MTLIKFPFGHMYYGYGYDIGNDRMISYKRNANGQQIGDCWSTNVKINSRTVPKSALKYEAKVIQNQTALQKSKPGIVITAGKSVEGAPPFAYIMFSVKHECSQYFENGTTIAHAILMLQKRFPTLTGADVEILNPVTHGFIKPTMHTVTTYSF